MATPQVSALNFYFFFVWMVLTSVMYTVGGAMMYMRRNVQPVKARETALSLLTNFGFVLGTCLRCIITIVPTMPCIVFAWETPISIGYVTSIFLLRSWRVFFKFELANERSLQGATDPGNKSNRRKSAAVIEPTGGLPAQVAAQWYSDHRYLISKPFMIGAIILSIALFFTPVLKLTLDGTVSSFMAGDTLQCIMPGWFNLIEPLFGVAILIGIFVFAIKLRKTFDAFGIKHELKSIFLLEVASWTTVITISQLKSVAAFDDNVFRIRKLTPLMFFVLLFIETTIIPVYRSFTVHQQETDTVAGGEQDLTTLAGILKDSAGFALFQQYLIGCFCVESTLFWKEIEGYRAQVCASLRDASTAGLRDLPDISVLMLRANEINVLYIQENAKLQVNISAGQRQRVEHSMKNLNTKYKESDADIAKRSSMVALDILQPTSPSLPRGSLVRLVPDEATEAGSPPPAVAPEDAPGIKNEIKEKYKDILNVFNIAQLEVFELMRTDPFPRFRATKAYLDLSAKSKLKNLQNQELKKLNVI